MADEVNVDFDRDAEEYATLTVSGESFCINISDIKETRRWSEITFLPHSPNFILGAMNLRGVVIPIIDLCIFLDLDRSEPSDRHVIIVIERENRTFGLVSDSVQEILSVSLGQIHKQPIRAESDESIILGLISNDDQMIRILDTEKICEIIDES